MATKFFENTTEQSTPSQLFSLDTFLMAIWANNSLDMITVAPPETVVFRNSVAPTSTVAAPYETGDTAFGSHSPTTLALWATISGLLWWTVLIISTISLPILAHALYVMLHKFHKSNYFHFLTAMIVLDLLMLLSILFNLLSDYAFAALKGSVMCKITAFITNVTSCYSNWLWVMMFAQRFVHIFFPMHRWRGKIEDEGTFFRILDDTPKLIFITGVMAACTQMWAPFLMTEVLILSPQGTVQGCYCGPDSTLVNKNLFKWIAAVESIWTYAMPFTITLLTDLAVLIYFPLDSSKRFTTISTEEVLTKKKSTSGSQHQLLVSNPSANSSLHHCARRNSILSSTPSNCALSSAVQSLKIQSEDSIRQTHKRRQRAIRRCLALASFQLVLNLPNYVLQLVDEFSNLRLTSQQFVVFYLYADALFYLLYLSQYPMLAIFIQWLHGNYNSRAKGNSNGYSSTNNSQHNQQHPLPSNHPWLNNHRASHLTSQNHLYSSTPATAKQSTADGSGNGRDFSCRQNRRTLTPMGRANTTDSAPQKSVSLQNERHPNNESSNMALLGPRPRLGSAKRHSTGGVLPLEV